MKNIFNLALAAVSVLSLAACGGGDKAKKPADSISTTVKIDSSTKTSTVIDSTAKDTAQKTVATVSPMPTGKVHDDLGSSSMRAVKDSIKKDSAKMSRK
jgi:predicted small lipoprotein YifL